MSAEIQRLQRIPDWGSGLPDGTTLTLGDPYAFGGLFRRRGDEWVRDDFAALDKAAGEAISALASLVEIVADGDRGELFDSVDPAEYASRSRDFGRGFTFALRELRTAVAVSVTQASKAAVPSPRTPDPQRFACVRGCGGWCVAGEPVCGACRDADKLLAPPSAAA